MRETKILGKGQLVIPANIRKKLGLKPGDIPVSTNPVKDAIGILPRRPSLAKRLLKDRARE